MPHANAPPVATEGIDNDAAECEESAHGMRESGKSSEESAEQYGPAEVFFASRRKKRIKFVATSG
jgi:hypothetical protein